MANSSCRRRSSQYSLFPNCTSPPTEPSIITNSRKSLSRNSSVSSASSDRPRKSADLPLRDFKTATNDEDNNIDPTENGKQQSKQSDKMARLISLKPEAVPATNSNTNLPSPSFLSKSSSITSFMPESPILPISPGSPISPKSQPKSQPQPKPRPQSRPRPGPVTDLTILPYTQDEWKKVTEEVKILYSKGQYKHCSMRCKQILDNIKDPHKAHSLYQIYLSFFAASSLEMTASTLHNHSSSKLPLFQESLFFYLQAQSSIDFVSFQHSHYSTASITSSVRSSVDSVFSSPANSARSSLASSPTDEILPVVHKRTISASSSFSSLNSRTTGRRHKKKVSFSIDINPSPANSDSEPELPLLPNSAAISSSLLDSFPAPPSQLDPSITSTKDLQIQPRSISPTQDNLSVYLLTQSLSRYRSHLRDLSTQLQYHISSIHSQISQLSQVRKSRRSALPSQFTGFEKREFGVGLGIGFGSMGMEGVSREEILKVELQERIRRLKENGWRRERFNGERYQLLCERALGEAAGGV
ncbi:uncharacterized protein PAC_00499 [Phialocephala subalpina]|uniref:Uncharacterized protein n=1 Tax=Phialocephala subalpina TaxID=576137 RepID=A0A1L7WCU5_9HELO|nr:uncharacterized protein PAC_00499 [Phialocephala subalpina]